MPDSSYKLLQFVLYSVIVILIIYVLVIGKSILMPLVISMMIAYMISALSETFTDLPIVGPIIPKWFAFLLSLLAVAVFLIILMNLVVSNVEQVIAHAPEYQERLDALLVALSDRFDLGEVPSFSQILNEINLAAVIRVFLSPLSTIAGNTFIVILYVSFLLLERKAIHLKLTALLRNKKQHDFVEDTLDHIEIKIRKYVWIKFVISLFTAGFSYLVMAYLGIDFAAFWAVLIFALNFIPYIGSIFAVAFPVLLTLLQFDSFTIFFITLSLLLAIQIVASYVMEPKIMGNSLNLSPLMILLTLAVWSSIWGVVGMIICVPIMVVAMIIFTQFSETRPLAIIMSQYGNIDDLLYDEPD